MPGEHADDFADESLGKGKSFDVFISYASPDREVAKRLAEELAKHSLTTWVDEQDLKLGENWQEQIRAAINRSRLCLVLLSRATVPLKPWVSKEWSAIQECSWHRPDFSVCHLELEDVDTPQFLRGWQRLEMKESLLDIEKIASDVAALLMLPPAQLSVQSEEDREATERRFSEIWEAVRRIKSLDEGRDDE
jgi:TIR domain